MDQRQGPKVVVTVVVSCDGCQFDELLYKTDGPSGVVDRHECTLDMERRSMSGQYVRQGDCSKRPNTRDGVPHDACPFRRAAQRLAIKNVGEKAEEVHFKSLLTYELTTQA